MPDLADVVVVGGGVLGVAIAYELACKRFRVALLEAGSIGHGASGRGFAWINATDKDEDETYHRLNASAMRYYYELATTFGAETIGWRGGGALICADAADEQASRKLERRIARLRALDYPTAKLNRDEIAVLEPRLRLPESTIGLFAPADGWIDAPRLIRFLTDAARDRGVTIRPDWAATGFTRDVFGAVSTVDTTRGRIATRTVVIAAGLDTAPLVALLGANATASRRLAVNPAPGVLVEIASGALAPLAHRVVYPPVPGGLHLRPTSGGGALIGAEDVDSGPISDATLQSIGRGLIERAAQCLNGVDVNALAAGAVPRICVRPMPADERPVVGALEDVRGAYVAVTHSGMTLGPWLARLLAEQIATGVRPTELAPYRPDA